LENGFGHELEVSLRIEIRLNSADLVWVGSLEILLGKNLSFLAFVEGLEVINNRDLVAPSLVSAKEGFAIVQDLWQILILGLALSINRPCSLIHCKDVRLLFLNGVLVPLDTQKKRIIHVSHILQELYIFLKALNQRGGLLPGHVHAVLELIQTQVV
jgi:hypothetical protein